MYNKQIRLHGVDDWHYQSTLIELVQITQHWSPFIRFLKHSSWEIQHTDLAGVNTIRNWVCEQKCLYLQLITNALMHSFELSLNVFTEFAEFSDKTICHYSKTARTYHPATSCVKDQNATTVSARHMWETGSLNWAKFMLKWFIRFAEFSEFLFHLRKTQLFSPYKAIWHYFLQFQSLLDFCASVILLSSSLTVTDHYFVQDDGTVGWMQCHIWNSKLLLWAFFGCSTWNIVSLTIER